MKPKLSIIVPVYNVELYLHKCIKSILTQSFTDFELILVNDGSQDNCKNICEEYSLLDSRIRVINKANGGLASARNAGLDIARGDFIGFVDSDDYIEEDMYELLYNSVIEHHADVAECSINIINIDKSIHQIQNTGEIFVGDNEYALTQLLNNGYRNSVWNKIYNRELFINLRFPNKLYEDGFLVYKILLKSRKYVFIGKSKYNYFKRTDSIMSKQESFSLKQLDGLESQEERFKYLRENNCSDSLLFLSEYHYFLGILSMYKKLNINNKLDQNSRLRRNLKNKIQENSNVFLLNPRLKNYKILIKFSFLNFTFYNVLFLSYLETLHTLYNIKFKVGELTHKYRKMV